MIKHDTRKVVIFGEKKFVRLQQILETNKKHMDDFLYVYDESSFSPVIFEGERIENFPNKKYK